MWPPPSGPCIPVGTRSVWKQEPLRESQKRNFQAEGNGGAKKPLEAGKSPKMLVEAPVSWGHW